MNPNETCFNVLGNEIVFPTQYFHYNWISYSYTVTYRDGHGCMLRELDMSHLAYTDCESVTNIYSIRPAIWLYQLWLNFLLKLKLTIFTFDRQQEMLVQSVTNSHWSLIRRHKISRRSLELFNTKSIDFKKWNVELAPIFCYPICSLKLWRWLIVSVSAILLFLSFRFFFHAVGKNSALSFPPPITIYNTSLSSSLHIARMLYLNVMRSPIELGSVIKFVIVPPAKFISTIRRGFIPHILSVEGFMG